VTGSLPPYIELMRVTQIRSRKRRVVLVAVLILGGVVIDLLFAAHPSVSVGLLLGAVAIVEVLFLTRRVWLRRSGEPR
jgi:inner membrane protein involved in colicin E2 resistance